MSLFEAVKKDFDQLTSIVADRLPSGVITDWKGALVSTHQPPITNHQSLLSISHRRCLSHVKRQLMRFLPLRSLIPATQKLRSIAKEIMKIEKRKDKILWKKKLKSWIKKYDFLLKEKTIGVGTKKKWWYTHGNLRRAIKLLTHSRKNIYSPSYPANFFPKPTMLLRD